MIAQSLNSYAFATVLMTTAMLLTPAVSAQTPATSAQIVQDAAATKPERRPTAADSHGLAVHYDAYGDL